MKDFYPDVVVGQLSIWDFIDLSREDWLPYDYFLKELNSYVK